MEWQSVDSIDRSEKIMLARFIEQKLGSFSVPDMPNHKTGAVISVSLIKNPELSLIFPGILRRCNMLLFY
jgi:hypothetical protein